MARYLEHNENHEDISLQYINRVINNADTIPHNSALSLIIHEAIIVNIQLVVSYDALSVRSATLYLENIQNIFGCDSSPRSPNVSMSVCLSHLLQLYWTSAGLLKDF